MNHFKARLGGRRGLSYRGDRGATAVEYGIMVGFIAVVIVVAVSAFGSSVRALFQFAVDSTPFFN